MADMEIDTRKVIAYIYTSKKEVDKKAIEIYRNMEDMECDSMKQGRLLRIYASKKAIDKKGKKVIEPNTRPSSSNQQIHKYTIHKYRQEGNGQKATVGY